MSPNDIITAFSRWQPVVYVIARGVVYGTTFVLGAVAVWYGSDPAPDWVPRAVAVAAFAAGPLALVNLRKPER